MIRSTCRDCGTCYSTERTHQAPARFRRRLITAAVCDYRVAVNGGARFALNEVPIGIPMPAVGPHTRLRVGRAGAVRTCLLGEVFSPAQARALGVVHELVLGRAALDWAIVVAGQTPEPCLEQYAFTQTGLPGRRLARHRRARRPTRWRASRQHDE